MQRQTPMPTRILEIIVELDETDNPRDLASTDPRLDRRLPQLCQWPEPLLAFILMTCRAYAANMPPPNRRWGETSVREETPPNGETLLRGVLETALAQLCPTEPQTLSDAPVEPFEDIR